MIVEILEQAETELSNAVKYYNEQNPGLGLEFALEVKKTIERIVQFPSAWFSLSSRAKRCRCNRFPYALIYFVHDDKIIIIAVMHMKRKPDYWQNRL